MIDKNRILIIEDDVESSIYLKEFLEEGPFIVDLYDNVTDAIAHIEFTVYDIIILDLNLPDYDGYEVLKYLNQENIKIPVIVLSAYSEIEKKLKAFRLGACDYIVKPIDPNELEARIWVHLRNNSKLKISKPHKELDFKIVDQDIYVNNKALMLTKTEFKILKILLDNFGNAVPREELSKELSTKSSDRSLDGHIKNIRKKLYSLTPDQKIFLSTVYGVGYKLHN